MRSRARSIPELRVDIYVEKDTCREEKNNEGSGYSTSCSGSRLRSLSKPH